MLIISMVAYSQGTESTYIYKYLSIRNTGEAFQDYKSPAVVTYFYQSKPQILVEIEGNRYIYKITSDPVLITDSKLHYYQLDGTYQGSPIAIIVFKDVGKYGVSVLNESVSISYHNVELNR